MRAAAGGSGAARGSGGHCREQWGSRGQRGAARGSGGHCREQQGAAGGSSGHCREQRGSEGQRGSRGHCAELTFIRKLQVNTQLKTSWMCSSSFITLAPRRPIFIFIFIFLCSTNTQSTSKQPITRAVGGGANSTWKYLAGTKPIRRLSSGEPSREAFWNWAR